MLMSKGQQLHLTKPDGHPLTLMSMNLGWKIARDQGLLGPLGRRRRAHLGSFAVLYGHGRFIDVIFSDNPVSPDGSIEHSDGPMPDGIGAKDDRMFFFVQLSKLPPRADRIVFVVSSFAGSTFEGVRSAHCRLVDESFGREIARYTFAGGGKHTALIMAEVRRAHSDWHMTAIGEPATGQTFDDLLQAIDRHS
ncbi:TerD family protein [Streptomyces sp. NPDC017056]|uniref:TerD family protein n=1 Tax=Streptomyces sp. NPDC017056 TaxID=3364973 RepID=UPI0037A3D2AB